MKKFCHVQSESQENRQQLSILLFLSYEGKSERIDQKIVETQNPCLKSNSVAGIWTSLWLHCFSWSESLALETHPTFWGCFVFTSFFSYLSLPFSCFCFCFSRTQLWYLFFDLGFDWKYVGVDDFFFYVYVWFTNVIANCFFFKLFYPMS